MREPAPAPHSAEAAARRFLTFRVDDRLYALPGEEVAEVIRIPPAARVPHAPAALIGFAQLRGTVLPLASLRALLECAEAERAPSSRAIVLEGASPVAVVVDAVQALVSVEPDRIEMRQAELAAEPGERLRGAFAAAGGDAAAKILDMQALLTAAFAGRTRRTSSEAATSARMSAEDAVAEAEEDRQRLVTFTVADQEYALDLADVREIIPAPRAMAVVPRAETLVLGVISYRETLLPLLSLRGLLGFPAAPGKDGREKVVIARVAGGLVGLLVDGTRAIVAADPRQIDPVPAVLAARAGGEARIRAIYRDETGRRLISILAPEQLFREDVMQRLGAQVDLARSDDPEEADRRTDGGERQFLVFRLGGDEFALPVETVDEVARLPERIARLPKAPKFLEGVVNLRGEVLPIVDQRRRFEMPALEEARERRRLVVVRSVRDRAGLIVDSVSGVLRTPAGAVEPTPSLTDDTSRLVHGVLNLDGGARIVLVLDPAELLSRAERDLLDAFSAQAEKADL